MRSAGADIGAGEARGSREDGPAGCVETGEKLSGRGVDRSMGAGRFVRSNANHPWPKNTASGFTTARRPAVSIGTRPWIPFEKYPGVPLPSPPNVHYSSHRPFLLFSVRSVALWHSFPSVAANSPRCHTFFSSAALIVADDTIVRLGCANWGLYGIT